MKDGEDLLSGLKLKINFGRQAWQLVGAENIPRLISLIQFSISPRGQ